MRLEELILKQLHYTHSQHWGIIRYVVPRFNVFIDFVFNDSRIDALGGRLITGLKVVPQPRPRHLKKEEPDC